MSTKLERYVDLVNSIVRSLSLLLKRYECSVKSCCCWLYFGVARLGDTV